MTYLARHINAPLSSAWASAHPALQIECLEGLRRLGQVAQIYQEVGV